MNKVTHQTQSLMALKPIDIFPAVANQKGSVWLDSTLRFDDRGQRSFIAFNPSGELVFKDGEGIYSRGNEKVKTNDLDIFLGMIDELSNKPNSYLIGYLSYETSIPFLNLPPSDKKSKIPEIHFFLYDFLLTYNHETEKFDTPLSDEIIEMAEKSESIYANNIRQPKLTASIDRELYNEKILKVKDHIREGDIYQANFTSRFDIESSADPFAVYQKLRELNPAPYGAYLNFGDYQVLSSSPERMFKREKSYITSSPIKGTISIGKDDVETKRNLQVLLNSEKDKAELLMIVDLVRNDLGKIAKPGTVKVDQLFKPEIYSSLIHLVSDISAELKDNISIKDIFKAMLPGGSITGTPKRRAVRILEKLESQPRSVYTGNIGIISKGRADFNIAIRTMTHKEGQYHIQAGGGIVADSDPDNEYDEMNLKAMNLLKALGLNNEK